VKDSEFLFALKAQLAQYKTFSCRLQHENIITVEPNEGTDNAGFPLEPIVNRIGFCNHNVRSFAINCAHTTSAIKFKDLIKNISQNLETFQGDTYIKAIDDLLCEIYLLDHKRGRLEKEYAFAEFYEKGGIEGKKAKLEINNSVAYHSTLVAELELLRKKIAFI